MPFKEMADEIANLFCFLPNISMFNDVFDFLLPIIIHFDEPNILDYNRSNHTQKKFKEQKINLFYIKWTLF
jgi:hypothetical protein